MTTIYVNADWSAVVPAGSAEAAFGVQPQDAKRLGVLDLPVRDGASAPPVAEERHVETLLSANAPALEPVAEAAPERPVEPEAKEAPPPANKAVKKPATKGVAGKDTDGNGD